VAGVRVLGPANLLPKLRRRRVNAAIVAIGDNRTRQQYIAEARAVGLRLVNAIHPRAIVSRSARLGENLMIAAGAVVCAEATIGDGTIVNTSAVVDHECVLDPAVHVGPTAALAGRVRVGTGAFIGLGAKVLPCLGIGAWSTVGAGAVVIEDLPDGVTVVGVPARRTR
jgi:UDP-perosamine 4-acetyltransferase